jgi:hypothetical protein
MPNTMRSAFLGDLTIVRNSIAAASSHSLALGTYAQTLLYCSSSPSLLSYMKRTVAG